MNSVNNLRERENISSTRNLNKGVERNVLRNKTKALGDVQNTLHFRSVNSLNSTGKVSDASKSVSISNDNAYPFKTPKTERKARGMVDQCVHSVSKIEPGWLDIHNHFLCEEAARDSISDFLLQYKLTEKQIDSLVKSVKKIGSPLLMPEINSCADIEIPRENYEEKSYDCVISDLFDDFVLPKVPAPVNVL